MDKAVLISIRPEWCEKIICGRKTMELRKSVPNLQAPFKCYIYMTKHRWVFRLLAAFGMSSLANLLEKSGGKVIGSFVCDSVLEHCEMANADIAEQQSLVKREKILQYASGKHVYGWHISDLRIYDEPKPLWMFVKPNAMECEEMDEMLCGYCERTDYGKCATYGTPSGPVMCEGMFCDEAYQEYLDDEGLTIARPPQSWCYVKELLELHERTA